MKRKFLLLFFLCSAFSNYSQIVTTFAGSTQGFADGTGTAAQFAYPTGVAFDTNSNNLFVADYQNNRIRKITPDAAVSVLAGSSFIGYQDGTGTDSYFNNPQGVATDSSGNVYVADTVNNKIRKITPAGVVTTFAGSSEGTLDGTGTSAQFSQPVGITVDVNGNVYVSDSATNRIRKITPGGVVTTLAGSVAGFFDGAGSAARFNHPSGLTVDASGNVYVADTVNQRIRKITPAGVVTTIAGSTQGYLDGLGTAARFLYPSGIAIDSNGNLYVADTNNHKIRKITPSGDVSTFAGATQGYVDGTGSSALFNYPSGITIDADGNLFVADYGNHKIRKITQTLGTDGHDLSEDVKIYPNPAHDLLYIDIENFSTSVQISITDILGKILYSQKTEASTNSIITSNYSKGIYFITLTDGTKASTKKLIIE